MVDQWQRLRLDIGAGTLAGFAVCIVGHPFDTIKVRLQTQSVVNPTYAGTLDCFRKTIRFEGIRGLYKGVSSPLVGQMFFRSVLFSANGQSKEFLEHGKPEGRLELKDFFVAGAITGFAASFVESPVDLFKSQMQVQVLRPLADRPQHSGMFKCACDTLQRNGLRGIYQGLSGTLLRNIPANCVYFGTNQQMRLWLASDSHSGEQLSSTQLLLAGGTAGLLYWLMTFPADVIKSSLQSDDTRSEKRRFRGIVDCTSKLYREGGIARFFRGITPCLLRSVPANAVMWLVFEKSHAALRGMVDG